MPRLKKADPRRNRTLRLSDDETAQLERAALMAGESFSEYVRSRALGGTGHLAEVPSLSTERHRQAAAALAEQLRRIGVNLNQMLRHVHQHPDERVPADAPLLLAQIRDLVRQARAL